MNEQAEYHAIFMQRAIALSAKASLEEKSGGAFGAVVVKEGKIIGEGYNQVITRHDPTWHAEMHAIREACRYLKTPHLTDCDLYTSAECCPMCLSAAYWAHIRSIFFASTIADSLEYGRFEDGDFLAEIRKEPHQRRITSQQLHREEALVIWQKYRDLPERQHY